MNSKIPNATIEAFLSTHYCVFEPVKFTLQIGVRSGELHLLQKKSNCHTSAFITAWNPFSEVRAEGENANAQEKLIREIGQHGWNCFPGEGLDPKGEWPGEPSLLILGISRQEATQLSITYKQNAFVWMDSDAIPELILLR